MRQPIKFSRQLKLGVSRLAMFAALLWGAGGAAHAQASRFDEASQYFERGAFEQAAEIWRRIVADPKHGADHARAHLGIAAASQRLGLYQEASQALAKVQSQLGDAENSELAAQYYRQLGNLQVALHRHEESLTSFSMALTKSNDVLLRAAILTEYGNALAIGGFATDAVAAYRQSQSAARSAMNSSQTRQHATSLAASATLNLARLQTEQDDEDAARTSVNDAANLLDNLDQLYEWATMQLVLTDLDRSVQPDSPEGARERLERLQQVQAYAQREGNARLLSQAYGDQAKDTPAIDAAQALTRKAIFFASQAAAHDLLYRWRWQLATLQRRAGDMDDAIASFEQAVAALTPIRQELLNGYHDSQAFFRQQIRPVYLEYVDALLARVDVDVHRPMLERARNAMEALAGAELQDYFRDQCVVEQQHKAMTIEQAAPHAAVLYPIVLGDRVELLLSVNGELHRHAVPVDRQQVLDSAVRLREFIQDPASDRYLPYAQRLYRWLIEPVQSRLIAANADTLVLVPDGVLRTIPFAALHSGDRFLVEEFALAMTPGITLTAPPRSSGNPAGSTLALLTGVAQPVQGFAPLPKVSAELSAIREYVGGTVLANREYTKANLKSALEAREYGIVHMATHSVVGGTPADSFLLTYDGKLTMSDLEYLLRIGKFRDNAVELLTLSACETAIGDERAALGLAGIAVKSGAKSVLASLWLVEDESTAALMNRFYRNIGMRHQTGHSKAKALRAAQRAVLTEPATGHPAHWAAFALIGSWQ